MPTIHAMRCRLRKADAFTLVELVVVLVIIAILSALTLSGLAGARQRAKADKTRSTIRKLDEIVASRYEDYLHRRVKSLTSQKMTPWIRLRSIRLLQALELPDQWNDVLLPEDPRYPRYKHLVTAPALRYAALKKLVMGGTNSGSLSAYGDAECLAAIVMRGGFDSDVVETFRADEVGDIDRDGAPEFWDGWGRPIRFIRWPAAYQSVNNPAQTPDPFDPMGVLLPPDHAVSPLIYSGGPDEAMNDPLATNLEPGYGLMPSSLAVRDGWLDVLSDRPSTASTAGSVTSPDAADNITNYDLLKK